MLVFNLWNSPLLTMTCLNAWQNFFANHPIMNLLDDGSSIANVRTVDQWTTKGAHVCGYACQWHYFTVSKSIISIKPKTIVHYWVTMFIQSPNFTPCDNNELSFSSLMEMLNLFRMGSPLFCITCAVNRNEIL